MYHMKDEKDWAKIPGGNAVSVGCGADGESWCVTRENKIYRWEGGDWKQMPGAGTKISVGSAKHIVLIGNNGHPYRWNGMDWQELPGEVHSVGIGHDGDLWAIGNAERIYHFEGGDWKQKPGAAVQVSVHSANHIIVLNNGGKMYAWDSMVGDWKELPGQASCVSAGKGVVACCNSSGNIYIANI